MACFAPRFLKNSIVYINVGKSFRYYSKNILRRRPIKVLNLTEDPVAPIRDVAFKPKFQLTNENTNTAIEVPGVKETKIMIPPYEKLQKVDSRFTNVISMIKNRKLREFNGKILLEGKRMINDAIDAGVELQTIFFSREKDLADIKVRKARNVEILKVLYTTMKMWSDLATCPGVIGIFKKPSVDDIHLLSDHVLPVNVLCDNIRDPGNLGSVIRNAAAAGCENILMMKGCVDPWETKVLKTACGGHFRIPIVNNIEWTQVSNYIHKDSKIYIADNSADIDELNYSPEFINYDESPEDAEDEDSIKKYVTMNEHDQIVEVDETYEEPNELEQFEDVNLPCYLYSSVKYPKDKIVLYVGGETHGVDSRIVKLACNYQGQKIKIPLENSMDSLNSSFAMTIILYEIKRQFGERFVTK